MDLQAWNSTALPEPGSGDADIPIKVRNLFWLSFISLLDPCIIVGNLVVMVTYWRERNVQLNPTNLFIVHLSFADFMAGVWNGPFIIINEAFGRWPFGESMCKLVVGTSYLFTFMSVPIIICISAFRLYLIHFPAHMRSRLKRKHVIGILTLVWLIFLTFYLYLAFIWPIAAGYHFVDYTRECYMEYLHSPRMVVFMVCFEFFVPFALLLALSTALYVSIRRLSKSDSFPENALPSSYRGVTDDQIAIRNIPDRSASEPGSSSSGRLFIRTNRNREITTSILDGSATKRVVQQPFSTELRSYRHDDAGQVIWVKRDPQVKKNRVDPQPTDNKESSSKYLDINWVMSAVSSSDATMSAELPTTETGVGPSTASSPRGLRVDAWVDPVMPFPSEVSTARCKSRRRSEVSSPEDITCSPPPNRLQVDDRDVPPIQDAPLGSQQRRPPNKPNGRNCRGWSIRRRADISHHRKAGLMLFTLVLVLMICWLPFHIASLVQFTCAGCVSETLTGAFSYFISLNSFLNPFLYAATNVQFRKGFIKLLRLPGRCTIR